MTQCERILDYFDRYPSRGITHKIAENELGICRLASRICDLRADGYKIDSKTERVVDRFGESTYVARYFLVKESK